MKIAGSGSFRQMYGSVDPDSYQNVTDSQHCKEDIYPRVCILKVNSLSFRSTVASRKRRLESADPIAGGKKAKQTSASSATRKRSAAKIRINGKSRTAPVLKQRRMDTDDGDGDGDDKSLRRTSGYHLRRFCILVKRLDSRNLEKAQGKAKFRKKKLAGTDAASSIGQPPKRQPPPTERQRTPPKRQPPLSERQPPPPKRQPPPQKRQPPPPKRQPPPPKRQPPTTGCDMSSLSMFGQTPPNFRLSSPTECPIGLENQASTGRRDFCQFFSFSSLFYFCGSLYSDFCMLIAYVFVRTLIPTLKET
jgi:hypothetical protein